MKPLQSAVPYRCLPSRVVYRAFTDGFVAYIYTAYVTQIPGLCEIQRKKEINAI